MQAAPAAAEGRMGIVRTLLGTCLGWLLLLAALPAHANHTVEIGRAHV